VEPTITVIYDNLTVKKDLISRLDSFPTKGVLFILIQKKNHKKDLLSGYDDYFVSYKDGILSYRQRFHTDRVVWTHDYLEERTRLYFNGYGDLPEFFTHFEGKQVNDVTWTLAQRKIGEMLTV